MAMRLLVREGDFRSDKAKVAAALAGVDCTIVPVASDDAAVQASTFKSLPMLETKQGVIAKSGAILRFFATICDAAGLYGSSPAEQALIDSYADWASLTFEQSLIRLFVKGKGKVPAGALGQMATFLDALNGQLALRTFVASERVSFADVSLFCAVRQLIQLGHLTRAELEANVPNVLRWVLTCAAMPAFKSAYDADPFKGAAKASRAAPAAATAAAGAGAAAGGASAPAAAGAGGDGVLVAHNPGSVSAGALSAPPVFKQRWSRGRARVAELLHSGTSIVGQQATVGGWVRTIRGAGAGALQFVALSDGSSFETLQLVVDSSRVSEAEFQAVKQCGGAGAAVRAQGEVVASKGGKQAIELAVTSVTVLGTVGDGYQMAKGRMKPETLRTLLHLRPRSNLMGAVSRMRNALAFAVHRFFQERGFLYVHTPLVTTADCEGAGEMFAVTTMMPEDPTKTLPRNDKAPGAPLDYSKDFFKKPAFLTVSGQLQVETHCCSLSDVYTFGPTFRAEDSHTSRHLAEFWMIEPEIAFGDLQADMDLAEDFLKYCTAYALQHCSSDLAFFDARVEKGLIQRLQNVLAAPFQRITYDRAIEILTDPKVLKKAKFVEKPVWGIDLGSEHERYLTEQVFKKPTIITNYPKDIKAFYMKVDEDGRTVAAMDLLVPRIGEVIGGSQREERLDVLRQRMEEMNVPEEHLQWYLDLRKFGTVPHSGFGLGFERLIMYITGVENIRDVIPFPRYPGHAD